MFKLVVLFAVVAVAVAKPGYLHGGLGYHGFAAPVVAAPIAIPAAVSYTHRYFLITQHCQICLFSKFQIFLKYTGNEVENKCIPIFIE